MVLQLQAQQQDQEEQEGEVQPLFHQMELQELLIQVAVVEELVEEQLQEV